ncbi:hypothetical protein JOD67_003176 [Tenggerimyces flavus]|nr:hypothetical protein [Tenggerimyces flavus]
MVGPGRRRSGPRRGAVLAPATPVRAPHTVASVSRGDTTSSDSPQPDRGETRAGAGFSGQAHAATIELGASSWSRGSLAGVATGASEIGRHQADEQVRTTSYQATGANPSRAVRWAADDTSPVDKGFASRHAGCCHSSKDERLGRTATAWNCRETEAEACALGGNDRSQSSSTDRAGWLAHWFQARRSISITRRATSTGTSVAVGQHVSVRSILAKPRASSLRTGLEQCERRETEATPFSSQRDRRCGLGRRAPGQAFRPPRYEEDVEEGESIGCDAEGRNRRCAIERPGEEARSSTARDETGHIDGSTCGATTGEGRSSHGNSHH